jgi:hypothetical protein
MRTTVPTKAELEQTRADLAATQFTLPQFLEAIRTKKNYAYKTTPWYRALMAVADPKVELDRLLALQIAQLEPPPVEPVPVPPPTNGVVWHDDGWDSGTHANWSYVQPNVATQGSFVAGYKAGSKAFRVTLRAGVVGEYGSEAAQVTKVNPGSYRLDGTDWYAYRGNLRSITDCFDFITFAYPVIRYGAISVNVQGGNICLHMNTGRTEPSQVPLHDFAVWADPLALAVPGQWFELLIGIKRATGATGALTIEHRPAGTGTWRTAWSKSGIPTAQWGTAVEGWGRVDAGGLTRWTRPPTRRPVRGRRAR